MAASTDAREVLLSRVITYAAAGGIAGRSLREIAAGAGTSHRMLLYHFGSREGLMAAIVQVIEARQRADMTALTATAGNPRGVMSGLWEQVSSPELRPFVRLFFEVVGQAVQGAPGTEALLASLTQPWLEQASTAAVHMGQSTDPAALRLGVAVTRGLLLDLAAGADEAEVRASYERFMDLLEAASPPPEPAPSQPAAPTGRGRGPSPAAQRATRRPR
jgi:AcrR family transcriptional regulator